MIVYHFHSQSLPFNTALGSSTCRVPGFTFVSHTAYHKAITLLLSPVPQSASTALDFFSLYSSQTMDGRNFHGNRISLLNDAASERISGPARRTSPQAPHHHASLSYRQSRNHSHSSNLSYSTATSTSSPPTPQLIRSSSSESTEMQRTPSPLTPDLNFDGLAVTNQKYADPATAFASASPYHASAHHISQPYLDTPRSPLISEYVGQSQLKGQKRSMYDDVPEPPTDQSEPQESRPSIRHNSASSRSNRNGKNQYPCRWQDNTNAKTSSPPPDTQHDMQRSTPAGKMLSVRSATRLSRARITWSSIDAHISMGVNHQKKPPIVPSAQREPKHPPSAFNHSPSRLRYLVAPILLHP